MGIIGVMGVVGLVGVMGGVGVIGFVGVVGVMGVVMRSHGSVLHPGRVTSVSRAKWEPAASEANGTVSVSSVRLT